jgi:hypothetical protein
MGTLSEWILEKWEGKHGDAVGKVKVQLSLCLINQTLCHKDLRGSGGIDPLFLTSALDGGHCSTSRSCPFTPGERVPCTHWIGSWVGPRADQDAVE